jgi:hypothetical protein
MTENKSIEKLKNALLTLLLVSVNKKDFDKNFDYSKYDGTKLPPMSGSSLENALLTYIIDQNELKGSKFYTKTMDIKSEAINKYINKNLNTDKKILKLLSVFLKKNKVLD